MGFLCGFFMGLAVGVVIGAGKRNKENSHAGRNERS
jgi:hypothetical protein